MSETIVVKELSITVSASSGFPENLSTVNSIRQRRVTAETNVAEEEWKSNRNYFRAWQLRLLAADLRDRGARFYTGYTHRKSFSLRDAFQINDSTRAIYKI